LFTGEGSTRFCDLQVHSQSEGFPDRFAHLAGALLGLTWGRIQPANQSAQTIVNVSVDRN